MKNLNRAKSGVVAGANDLATTHPDIVQEWDYGNNTDIEPYELSYGSNYVAHWRCTKGHSYELSVRDRVGLRRGCPVCSGTMIVPGINDFATKYPELAKEWHPTLNGTVKPSEIAPKSNKKFFWICEKGHTYDAGAYNRTMGQGCPFCANRRLLVGFNDLKTRCPEAAEDWDYEMNEGGPEDYKYCSNKSAHWKCARCGNKWESRILDRAKAQYGCKNCAKIARGQAKSESHALRSGGIQNPLLLEEWDYEQNEKSPSEYSPQSNKYAYWICSKCGYHYRSKISNRANGRNCACCSNKVVVSGINDLATTHPQLAKEWHPSKNMPLTPDQVTYGKGKKVWWVCPNGHEYPATILHRASGGTNCPICNSGRQTSFAEQAVYYYVKKVFPDAISRYTDIFDKGMELDIYIPSIRLGIEYDGMAWHKADKRSRETKKYRICKENGIRLLRLMEKPPQNGILVTADESIAIKDGPMHEKKYLAQAIHFLLDRIDPESNPLTRKKPIFHSRVDINLDRDEADIRKYMTTIKDGSFGELYPELARDWHPDKNGDVTPYKVKPHSDIKVWWICPHCSNEYFATIGHRTSGTGCPHCGKMKSIRSRSKRVEMIDRETKKILRTFESASEASRQMRISAGNINAVLHRKRAHAGGYFWQYEENDEDSID